MFTTAITDYGSHRISHRSVAGMIDKNDGGYQSIASPTTSPLSGRSLAPSRTMSAAQGIVAAPDFARRLTAAISAK